MTRQPKPSGKKAGGCSIKGRRCVQKRLNKYNGYEVEGKGDHIKGKNKEGKTVVTYYDSEDYPLGTARAIEKALIAAGMIALIMGIVLIGGYVVIAVIA